MKTKTNTIIRSVALLWLGALAVSSSEAAQGPQPTICTRSCWSARAPQCGISQMGALNRAIIHHTAGSSDWTTDYNTGKAKARSVQNIHMDGNGWCDIAYHFLVNAAGHIYEGRSGSMSSLPRGSHDGNNTDSFGFTALGYYHSPYNHSFTAALQDSLYDVIAWRMPSSWSPYGSGSYNGNTVGRLDGHRKVKSTACPGDVIYAHIGSNYSDGPARDGVWNRKNGVAESVAAPGGLTAVRSGCASIVLNWNDNSGNETGFKIESAISTAGFAQIATVGANVRSYTVTGLAVGTRYTFRVRGYNATINSGYSNQAADTTAPLPTRLKCDVNGDGKQDLVLIWNNGGRAHAQVDVSTGTGFIVASNNDMGGYNSPGSNIEWIPMDVNGDGKTDLVAVWNNAGRLFAQVSISNGSAFTTVSNADLGGWDKLNINRFHYAMDVNADGKQDLVLIWNNAGRAFALVNLSNGNGFTASSNADIGTFSQPGVNMQFIPMDANGDGKTDLVTLWKNGGSVSLTTLIANGTGFNGGVLTTLGGWQTPNVTGIYMPADVNGDGKKDLVLVWNNAGRSFAQVNISAGTTFATASNLDLGGWDTPFINRFWFPMDANGDGKEDLVLVWNNAGSAHAQVCISGGTSFTTVSNDRLGGFLADENISWTPTDFNGDGKVDLAIMWNNDGETWIQASQSTGTTFTSISNAFIGGWDTPNITRLWLPRWH